MFAGLVLAAGLFVFASVLNDSFSPVVYQSSADTGGADDDGFDGELRSDYDYRYGWSFVACSLAFLVSEASAVFTITAYFRRLEDHVQYTAVDRKPSPDTPPSACGVADRTSSASDGRPGDSTAAAAAAAAAETTDLSMVAPAGRPPVQDCEIIASSSSSSGAGAAECNGTVSKTPPDICPPKIGCDETAKLQLPYVTGGAATLSHPSSHKQHHHHQQHYRQALAVGGGNGPCYEVDATKPCTCASATTTKRYATIAGVARHNGGKQYTTTTTTCTAATALANANNKRSVVAAGLAAIKESPAADHHQHVQHHQHHVHRKPDPPPTRRLKASVGGYVIPQTPIAALEALDCPPVADPRLVLPSSV